jgi:hypothetical protein
MMLFHLFYWLILVVGDKFILWANEFCPTPSYIYDLHICFGMWQISIFSVAGPLTS